MNKLFGKAAGGFGNQPTDQVFAGFALFIYYTAVYIYLLEIVPEKFRIVVSTLYMVFWSVGHVLFIFIFLMVKKLVIICDEKYTIS